MSVELDASRGLTRANVPAIPIENRRYNVYVN